MIIALDETLSADSTRFFDDGQTANTVDTQYFTLVRYRVENGTTLTVTIPQKGYKGGLVSTGQILVRILVQGQILVRGTDIGFNIKKIF